MAAYALNWVDYTIVAIIFLSMLISFFRGFVREALSLVIWGVGILLALKFATAFQAYLPDFITQPLLRYGLAFILLFIAIFIVGILINCFVHVLVQRIGLSFTDRLLGLFFGALRGLLVSAVFLMFMTVGQSEEESSFSQSRFAPHFQPLVVWLETFLPEQVQHVSHWTGVSKMVSSKSQ